MTASSVDALILSSTRDLATDIVCHRLAESGTSFLRLNQDRLYEVALTLDPVRGCMTCRYGGKIWSIDREALRSVWWRLPTFRRDAVTGPTSLAVQLTNSQWPAFMRGLMLFDESRWYNLPAATYRAEAKPYQLHKAARLGFAVPRTLVTNDRHAPVSAEIGDRVALKSVDTIYLLEKDAQRFTYTNVVDWTECADDDFHLLPATVQSFVSPKLDLRVTIVGGRLWCHSVTVGGRGVEGDWRLLPKDNLAYRPYELPPATAEHCMTLVRELGLGFAAIDLALTDEGIWFIEINPSGEWAWLDSEGSIGAAIAEELSR